eukprot:scaffold24564_cov30-Tisochrysis_lutea.AAC.3
MYTAVVEGHPCGSFSAVALLVDKPAQKRPAPDRLGPLIRLPALQLACGNPPTSATLARSQTPWSTCSPWCCRAGSPRSLAAHAPRRRQLGKTQATQPPSGGKV